MLNKIKKVLIKTKIYSLYKKKNGREQFDEAQRVIKDEFSYSLNSVPDSRDALYGKIRLRIHGFEKVLVKGDIPKQDGVTTLFPLTERLLNDYIDYPRIGDAVAETIGVVQSVIAANKYGGVDCSKLQAELDGFIKRNGLSEVKPRMITIHRVEKEEQPINIATKYDSFVRTRHSIREYTGEIVDEQVIREIVTTALICPSACNRQPCKVYYSPNPEKIRDLFPDKSVTKDVFNLLVVTVNKSFYNVRELFQPWLDGGIFVESLIMAIHSRGLGACLFQYVKTNSNYQKLKDRVGIPDNEDILCCVGFGYLKDEYPIIETHRKDVSEMLVQY